MNDYKMAKHTQEMQNRYSCGHEQMEKRPYLVVYESNDYILGFPSTSRAKQLKSHPSHTNSRLSTDKLDGEVMLDQLQFIHKADFTNLPKTSVPDADYQAIIDSLVSQIIKAKENLKKDVLNCPSFYDIINFTHNIPEFLHINKWLVVSSKHFNAYAKMCFIIPYNNDLDFGYLHSIDWEARGVNIIKKLKYTKQNIKHYNKQLKQNLLSIWGYFAH